jgi:hypothetical protein
MKDRKWGIISFLATVSKGIYEFLTGGVLFSFLQFDMCGTPVAACHTGGIVGGILVFTIFHRSGLHSYKTADDPS